MYHLARCQPSPTIPLKLGTSIIYYSLSDETSSQIPSCIQYSISGHTGICMHKAQFDIRISCFFDFLRNSVSRFTCSDGSQFIQRNIFYQRFYNDFSPVLVITFSKMSSVLDSSEESTERRPTAPREVLSDFFCCSTHQQLRSGYFAIIDIGGTTEPIQLQTPF